MQRGIFLLYYKPTNYMLLQLINIPQWTKEMCQYDNDIRHKGYSSLESPKNVHIFIRHDDCIMQWFVHYFIVNQL